MICAAALLSVGLSSEPVVFDRDRYVLEEVRSRVVVSGWIQTVAGAATAGAFAWTYASGGDRKNLTLAAGGLGLAAVGLWTLLCPEPSK